MSSLSTVILPDVLRSIDSTTFNGTLQPVGGPLLHSARIIRFQNNTNMGCFISWDGINNHDYLPPGSFLLLDAASNKENSEVFDVQQGTQFYVNGTAAGTGAFYISNYYGK